MSQSTFLGGGEAINPPPMLVNSSLLPLFMHRIQSGLLIIPQDIKNPSLETVRPVIDLPAPEAKMHLACFTCHYMSTQTLGLDVIPFLLVLWMGPILGPTMKLTCRIHICRMQMNVMECGVKTNHETTPSQREGHAVQPWSLLAQVRRAGPLCKICGVIILGRRPLPSRPILDRVKVGVSNRLVPVVMAPWNRDPLELTVPLHGHIQNHH